MDLNPADNPSVAPHVWRTGQAHGNVRVTFATASYGAGRVAAIGDSSPADDDTGDPSDSLHPGWDKAVGGVANRQIHLNACHWLLHPAPDVTPPAIVSGPDASAFDCSAVVSWTTDEAATSVVDYGADASYGSSASVAGTATAHAVTLPLLAPETAYHFRVSSSDAAGNGPTQSSDQALDFAQSQYFDLYLVDTRLPGMSGPELTKKLREFDATTPVLFYSGAAYESDKKKAHEAGAQGYLVKPVAGDDLIFEVARLIAEAQIAVAPKVEGSD